MRYATTVGALTSLVLLCTTSGLYAQPAMYRITFIDKGPDVFAPSSTAYEAALAEFSPRALKRRALHGKQPLLDTADQPLYAPYLQQLEGMGIHTMAPVRLRNCVIAEMDTLTALGVQALPFVKRVQRTKEYAYVKATEDFDCEPRRDGDNAFTGYMIGTDQLHGSGILGQGVVIGMIDNGFRDREHSSLAHLDVLGRFDVVEDQPIDLNGHGTITLSIIAGNAQDTLIGMAPYASYLLARSEDQRFERRQEEDNFCAALEWIERNGADIASASVGYRYFDEGEEPSRSYDDFDGRTTFPAQSVNRAVSLGLTCVTAMGNSGPLPRTLITPADADSVITVGGVDSSGAAWSGSSRGPTADGEIKPNVVALAVKVRSMGLGDERYIRADGTSTAAPQIAGGLALLKQLYPEARTYELRQAMYESTSNTGLDTAVGYGIPNFTLAAHLMGPGFGPPSVVIMNNRWTLLLPIFSFPFADVTAMMRTADGTRTLVGQGHFPHWWAFTLDSLRDSGDTIDVRLTATSPTTGRVAYFPSDTTWYKVTTQFHIACGVTFPSTITGVDEDFSNVHPNGAPTFLSFTRGVAQVVRAESTITIPGIADATVSITDLMGRQADVTSVITTSGASIAPHNLSITLPAVCAGWYVLCATNGHDTYTVPLIIEE